MENQNILTIKFNTLDDLAVQVADWNERLNHQCCGNCSNVEAPTVTVGETIDVEAAASEVAKKVDVKHQPEPVDKKAFYSEIRNWMGTDKVRAGKVLTVFKKHGVVGKISSDALTDDIITDLKTVMAGEE